jgi:transitional endoplasmic reticulum ATPase
MPATTWDQFERYRRQGLDARRAGEWESARTYLLEAARCMVELSKQARGEELRDARRQTAAKLLDLANDSRAASAEGRKPRSATAGPRGGGPRERAQASSEGEDGANAKNWALKEKPDITFDDVAGLEDVKEDIRLKMLYPFRHPELAERFGIKPGGGILLFGPPGTGKTMLARATAGELDAVFYTVSAADLLSKWVGEAEQNVKALFDAAGAERRAVIFIDEIEALIPARREEGGSGVMQRVVPQILQGMEGFNKKTVQPLLFMGATNVPWQLDPAVLRPGRFDEKVYIPLPDLPARRRILEIHLSRRPLADDVDIDQLAERLRGYSGADIKYIADRSATIPFLESVAKGTAGEISAKIIDQVIRGTPPSVSAKAVEKFDLWAKEYA